MENNVYSVLVTNIDSSITVEALTTFFSFTGNVIEVRFSDGEDGTKKAIVVFDNEESVKTAELMTGATLGDRRINIEQTTATEIKENEEIFKGENLPERTIPELPADHTKTSVAASLMAKGYILASDTFQKAVEFDKTHRITDTIKDAGRKVKQAAVTVDEKLHFTEYIALGATIVKSYVESVDEKYKVSETVTSTVKNIDEKIGFEEKFDTCVNFVTNGVDKIATSEPVMKMKQSITSFREDVNGEIKQLRPEQQELQPMAEETNEAPFEIVEQIQEVVEENELVPPPVVEDNIIVVGDSDDDAN